MPTLRRALQSLHGVFIDTSCLLYVGQSHIANSTLTHAYTVHTPEQGRVQDFKLEGVE